MQFNTNGSEAMRIDSSGNVGIGGNSSVGTKLHIENASGDAHIRLRGSSNYGILFTRHSDAALTGYVGSGNAVNLGSSNVALSAPLSGGNIIFQTNGTSAGDEKMRIDSSGNVGIGTTSPSQQLSLVNSSASKINIRGGGASTGYFLAMPDATNAQVWNAENGYIQFATNDTERMRILSGGGITFNGDTAAANALDDYEEGTWTPAIRSGGGTITSIFGAAYTKIGRLVHIQAYIQYNGSGNGNAFQISGLPYNAINHGYSAQVVDFGRGGKKGAYSRSHPGNNFLEFLYSSESTSSDRITIKGNQIGASYIIFSNTYQTS